jgi:hypothetical protein
MKKPGGVPGFGISVMSDTQGAHQYLMTRVVPQLRGVAPSMVGPDLCWVSTRRLGFCSEDEQPFQRSGTAREGDYRVVFATPERF